MSASVSSTYQDELSELRTKLNAIDEMLINLLISRFALTDAIGKLKTVNNQQIYDPLREARIIQNVSDLIRKNDLIRKSDNDSTETLEKCIIEIYREIMKQSKLSQSHFSL